MAKKNKTDEETSYKNLKKFCDESNWPSVLGFKSFNVEKVKEKARCDFRLPKVECIDNGAHPRWAIYCSCGTTIFGNSIKECQDSWRRHAEGKL